MTLHLHLTAPLGASWTPQYARVILPGWRSGTPAVCRLDGEPIPFQYTGRESEAGAEALARIGFEAGQRRDLAFVASGPAPLGNAAPAEIPFGDGATVGCAERPLRLAAPGSADGGIAGPFASYAGFPFAGAIRCEASFERALLRCVAEGPLYLEYELEYRFADHHRYGLRLRCFRDEPIVEVEETLALGQFAEMVWILNPEKRFDRILSRESFEGENQPDDEAIALERPADVLCRLQMPVLSEYFVPNNRGWFALYESGRPERGMLGILGLYGARWREPVANMPEVRVAGGRAAWHASLASGARFWMLYAGPVEKGFRVQGSGFRPDQGVLVSAEPAGPQKRNTEHRPLKAPSDPRLVFHRLHAEWNALRLDEHLDLDGSAVFDAACWNAPGFLTEGYREQARRNMQALPPLGRCKPTLQLEALLDPTPERQRDLYEAVLGRLEKWVRQFQGYREGKHDYGKNVIGFSRALRGLLLSYELLRKDGALTDGQARRLNALFVFAARRILDEGRWPHSRTWKHPDHPESSRDFYAYGGEHRPDRLVWTNCLPNFQSDPLFALAHLAAIFPDHPDAAGWLHFALDDIDRQLDAYCGRSGAWQESINYATYTFSYMTITFRAVRNRCGIDYFHDDRMRRFAGWLARFVGPVDKRWNRHTWPAIGNAVLPTGCAEPLLCFAGELDPADPLRADLIEAYRKLEDNCTPVEHYPLALAVMAPSLEPPTAAPSIRILSSEFMDEVGVSMRHRYSEPDESYLFQKIGFAKDHYEGDETAFNWYAKGTPLLMDYGTYSGDVGGACAHNLVEVAEEDSLRRGYLADHLFTETLDYTRCEVPVTLKLLWGRMRSFEEIESLSSKDPSERWKTPYFYIGDKNPVGLKCWKVRQLLFVKPDYVALFDRVHGAVPHRYNLHVTGTDIRRDGALITASGRFDLDLACLVRHPAEFEFVKGRLAPQGRSSPHEQDFFRLYNRTDGIYRTLLFARERGRDVRLEPCGQHGMRVTTPEYTDYVFLHDDVIEERFDDVAFIGRAGWIRRAADGRVRAIVTDGRAIHAFGKRFEGRGPWSYDLDGKGAFETYGGPARSGKSRWPS